MGIEPKDYARSLIAAEGGPETCVQPYTPANDRPGPYQGRAITTAGVSSCRTCCRRS